MSFFLKKKKSTLSEVRKSIKRKEERPKKKKTVRFNDDDISSESDVGDDEPFNKRRHDEPEDEDEVPETAQERKLRLAKKLLEEIEREEKERLEAKEALDEQSVVLREEDTAGGVGRRFRHVADDYLPLTTDDHFTYLKNAHKLSITCVAVAPNGSFLFSGGKEGRLVKWSFPDGKKLHTIKEGHHDKQEDYEGHTFSISAIAISTDCKYLASSDTNPRGVFLLWSPDNMSLLHRFHGHRAAVTGLVFRKATHTLYSSSNDRSIKVWDVADTAYVETLFGHSEAITSLDSLFRERAVSSGGRDSTVRLWKIPEESQLVFQGTMGQSIDIVKFLNEQHFVSAGEDGSISLWGLMKKKPLNTIKDAHGKDPLSNQPNWITSLASLVNSDVFASGSQDGFIKLWRVRKDYKRIEPLFPIPMTGFVNSLDFSSDGRFLTAGVGQEHRLGRWWKLTSAKNQVVIIPLNKHSSEINKDGNNNQDK